MRPPGNARLLARQAGYRGAVAGEVNMFAHTAALESMAVSAPVD